MLLAYLLKLSGHFLPQVAPGGKKRRRDFDTRDATRRQLGDTDLERWLAKRHEDEQNGTYPLVVEEPAPAARRGTPVGVVETLGSKIIAESVMRTLNRHTLAGFCQCCRATSAKSGPTRQPTAKLKTIV